MFNRKLLLSIILILLLSAILFITLIGDYKKAPPTLYLNGNIVTMDEKVPEAQAMLVADGIITAIGDNQEIQDKTEGETKIVDLRNQTVLPGLIDPHTHAALSASMSQMIDLSGFTHSNYKEMWTHLQKAIDNTPKGEWVVGMGIDPILIADLPAIDRISLDALTTEHPIVLFAQSLHTFWVNSMTFEKAGINKDTPDPGPASYYERDSNGELTGVIAEQDAILPIMLLLQEEYLTPDRFVLSAEEELKKYASNGHTTIVTTGLTGANSNMLKLFEHLSSLQAKKINQLLGLLGILPKRKVLPRHFVYLRHDNVELLPDNPNNGDDGYRILGVKHWYDGAPYTGSMYLDEPYQESELTNDLLHIPKGQKGKALIAEKEFETFLKTYSKQGWQLSIHSQGDASNREVIDAFTQLHQEVDIRPLRHRLEHCLLIPDTCLSQMQTIGMTPSFHINHLLYYGDALKNHLIGPERTSKILPIGIAQSMHLPYSLHADQPMFKSDPFRLMQTAIERQTTSGDTIGYHYKINIHQALRSMTTHAAWQIHMEEKIGSLSEGKYADFIILNQDPYTVDISSLQDIQVLKTYVNGNPIQAD